MRRERAEVVELARDPAGDPVLRAFKVIVDPYVGRIVVMEVVLGHRRQRGRRWPTRARAPRSGSTASPTSSAPSSCRSTRPSPATSSPSPSSPASRSATCSRSSGREPRARARPRRPRRCRSRSSPASKDDEKLSTSLHRLAEEDPSLRVRFDPTSRHLGDRRHGRDAPAGHPRAAASGASTSSVTTDTPPVPYFETILRAATCEGRLKKQTGGHGQFAVVNVKVEPIDPTSPSSSSTQVVGGVGAAPVHPGAVTHGIEKAMAHGGPDGQPVVGVRATLYDGKYHSVDSSEAAFETAGSMALKAALEKSGTALLERDHARRVSPSPASTWATCSPTCPGGRGKVMGTNTDESGATKVVTAHVPEAELARYGLELRSLSGGRGQASRSPPPPGRGSQDGAQVGARPRSRGPRRRSSRPRRRTRCPRGRAGPSSGARPRRPGGPQRPSRRGPRAGRRPWGPGRSRSTCIRFLADLASGTRSKNHAGSRRSVSALPMAHHTDVAPRSSGRPSASDQNSPTTRASAQSMVMLPTRAGIGPPSYKPAAPATRGQSSSSSARVATESTTRLGRYGKSSAAPLRDARQHQHRVQPGLEPGDDVGVHPVAHHRGGRRVGLELAHRRADHQRVGLAHEVRQAPGRLGDQRGDRPGRRQRPLGDGRSRRGWSR